MQQTHQCPCCNATVAFGSRFCGECGIPLDQLQNNAEQKQPLTVRVELLAEECGMLMACLSWVDCDLAGMKLAAQELDKKTEEVKVILGGGEKVEDMKRDVVGMVDLLLSMVRFMENCFITYIAKFFDDNDDLVSKEAQAQFFKKIQDRIGEVGRAQDLKLKIDALLRVVNMVE